MSGPDAGLTELFRDEATQRLDQMDIALLQIEAGGGDAEAVDSLFRDAHTIKGGAGMLGFDDIRMLAHGAEDVLQRVRAAGACPPAMAALLLRATAALRGLLAGQPAAQPAGAAAGIGELADELAASLAMLDDSDGTAAGSTGSSRSAEGDEGAAAGSGESSLAGDAESPAGGTRHAMGGHAMGGHTVGGPAAGGPGGVGTGGGVGTAGQRPALRVPAEKIDHLLDVAGEIMQDRRRLAHCLGAEQRLSQEVADALGAGERMLDDLKDTAVGMRTLPLAVIAGRLPRSVRDLAHAAGKEVDFVATGADTELDRVILESLSDPLVHLLRNAVVHGVEFPAEREQAGKPRRARVELRAVPRGSLVEVVVSDDGRGVSAEVMQEARRAGSLADLLAKPGYSTAGQVTDLAGRGVGLDAVRAYAHSLGGGFEIRSEPGQGMDIILLLPLALALVEVLLFERGGAVYGVPLAAVDEVVMVTATRALQGRPSVEVRGRSLQVTDFAALIGAAAPPLPDRSPALVVAVGDRRTVVTCDVLLGQEEVMIKPLGPLLAGLRGYLGAAILGDGRIALLVESAMLTRGSRDGMETVVQAAMPAAQAAMPAAQAAVPAARAAVPVAQAAVPVAQAAVPAGRAAVPAVPDAAGSAYPVGALMRSAPTTVAALRILVVEDSFTVRELQRSILEAAGYRVTTARDGRDALDVIDRDPEIALVVTDLEMPEVDGIELTRAIRSRATVSSLPVVIVTSRGSDDDRRRGIEAGADGYMAKRSFDQQALLATVERLVGR